MRAGEFDAALERFGRASLSRPKDPALRASLGLILSLKAVSQPEAVRSLEDSLSKRADEAVRWELLLLYLHLGLYADAEKLLGPDRIPLDHFFTPEIVTLRAGALCMADPGRRTLSTLERNATGAVGLYFLARCRAMAGEKAGAEKAFSDLKDALLKCRLVADVPELFNVLPGGPVASGVQGMPAPVAAAKEPAAAPGTQGIGSTGGSAAALPLVECRVRFPGTVHLFREKPRQPAKGQAVPPARKLFPDTQELPPYPEDHWRYQSGG